MIITAASIILIISLVLQIFIILLRLKKINIILPLLHGVIAVLLIIELVMRSIKIQFIALTNTYEALMFFSAIILILITIYEIFFKEKKIQFVSYAATIIALLFITIVSSSLDSRQIRPVIPALKSVWLIFHVSLSLVGEAFFVLSFAAALFYLFSRSKQKKETADKLIFTLIIIGYPVFTIGALIFGAIWAKFAWGRFWAWDPKETFALITWLVYTLYLQVRMFKRIPKSISAIIAVLGFLLTLFTFFGVNYLIPSLHSHK